MTHGVVKRSVEKGASASNAFNRAQLTHCATESTSKLPQRAEEMNKAAPQGAPTEAQSLEQRINPGLTRAFQDYCTEGCNLVGFRDLRASVVAKNERQAMYKHQQHNNCLLEGERRREPPAHATDEHPSSQTLLAPWRSVPAMGPEPLTIAVKMAPKTEVSTQGCLLESFF